MTWSWTPHRPPLPRWARLAVAGTIAAFVLGGLALLALATGGTA